MKSQAIVFVGKQRVELVDEEVSAPARDQVLVRTTVSLISTGTESHCFRGEFEDQTVWSSGVKYPFKPGYSAVGAVMEVGADVAELKPGDRVYTGRRHEQFATIAVDEVIKLPDGLSHETASWSTLAFVGQTAVRRAEHTMGDTAVVIGLGPLGQLVVQYLRVLGLCEVLGIDAVPMRTSAATEHGATATYCGGAADAGDFVAQHTDGRLADVVYDVTGHWSVLPPALKLARDFGRVVLLGTTPYPSKQHITQDVLTRQVTVIGSHNVKLQPQYAWWTRQRQIRLFHTYLQHGQMRVDDLITHRYPPSEAPRVYPELLADRSATLGVLFDWQSV